MTPGQTPPRDERMCERCAERLARHVVEDEGTERRWRLCGSCSSILVRYVGMKVVEIIDPPAKADA